MLAIMLAVFFSPLPTDFAPDVGETFWLASQSGYGDVWEAKVVRRGNANPSQPILWYEYPSLDGLTINDRTPVGRGHVYRTKAAAQVAVWRMAEAEAERAARHADRLRREIGK